MTFVNKGTTKQKKMLSSTNYEIGILFVKIIYFCLVNWTWRLVSGGACNVVSI